MTSNVGLRLAGEALKSFHEVGSGLLGEKLAQTVGGKLGETAGKFIAPTTQLAASGLVAGAENILQPVLNTAKQDKSTFHQQQYVPGTLSLTNEQAGQLYLDQMRLQNQLALLQQRQTMSSNMPLGPDQYGGNALGGSVGGYEQQNPYSTLSRAINTTYTY